LTRFRGFSWIAVAGFFFFFPHSGEPVARQARISNQTDRFTEWLAAADTHQPADPGMPAVSVSTWTGPELDATIAQVKRHARALARDNLEQANQLLLRGAALHADIARLIPDETTRRSDKQLSVYTIKDGRWQSIKYLSIHWGLGRSLVDAVMPQPAAHPGVRAWYRETSRDLILLRSLSEAMPHLVRAQQIFPDDGLVLFYRGVLHERYSSAVLQAGSDSLTEANRGSPTIGTPQAELSRAERFFRAALVSEPDHIEARLRHGRVLGDLGRHEEAVGALRRVVGDGTGNMDRYLAHLFLGRNYEALGDYEKARSELERAATLYPSAQTPHLALSHIARRTGDRVSARRELELLAKLPDGERQREDPWWDYYDIR
jgi:tetratricopeptide (TPR) repeat protein